MQGWWKYLYCVEAVLSLGLGTALVIAASVFVPIVVWGSLVDLNLSVSEFYLIALWVGGMMGVYALWSLFLRIEEGKRGIKIAELPWVSIICGVAANIYPIALSLFNASRLSDALIEIACLIPCVAAVHWTWFLTNKPTQIVVK